MSMSERAVKSDKANLVAVIFSSPGMLDNCKVVLQLNRRNILLLGRLIEAGMLTGKEEFSDEVLKALTEGAKEEFKTVHEELLKKTGLSDFYEHIKQL